MNEDKERKAIARLREAAYHSERLYKVPLLVTTSGGKDSDLCLTLAQRVGTYKYIDNVGMERTVPAVRIIDGAELRKSDTAVADQNNSGKTLFDKPGECVSRKNFKIKEVLESGDAIALEIKEVIYGSVFTSDLEVLILAQDDSNFYDNQIVKAPKGKCARQIGNYKYQQQYGDTKVIPIIAFK